jgi:hypothetical protein
MTAARDALNIRSVQEQRETIVTQAGTHTVMVMKKIIKRKAVLLYHERLIHPIYTG